MLSIKEVNSKTEMREFIKFPDRLYKGNKCRVTPLHSIEKSTLSKKSNSAFEYCEATYWLAYKDKKVVGRIAAIVNHKSNERQNKSNARFGWIDFVDDYKVSELLLATVEQWAKERNLDHVHGPFGFTDMDLEGMLVEGFDELGTQAVLYNFPYYPLHLEKFNYKKEVDWLQFEINMPKELPSKMVRVSNIVQQKYNLRVLEAKSSKDLLPYAEKMFKTLNAAYENLHEFVPLTDKQIAYYTRQYFSMIDPKYVCFVIDENDNVAGFGISVLSLSKAFIKAKGKLFPFGFIPVLKALKKNDTVDMLLQGVRPEYQNKGVAAIFYAQLAQVYIDNGIKKAISSHALEDNIAAFSVFKGFDNRQHLRRRCYGKDLVN